MRATYYLAEGFARVLLFLEARGLPGFGNPRWIYGRLYLHSLAKHELPYAETIADIVFRTFSPRSVLDLGCGAGLFLAALRQRGVDVLGVDGSSAAGAALPRSAFLLHDLRRPLDLHRRFDVVLCQEVAEHLPEKAAAVLVSTLCAHSETIVFSAAGPGEAGVGHQHLVPASWWCERFAARGFCLDEDRTARLRAGFHTCAPLPWLERNTMVFQATEPSTRKNPLKNT
ncbi:MAG: hypothetical protein A2284_00410 [Deltaproteobacteria bacterium RIFOXYA12_FULL_61_11]|nr:MAG: hypothetical protein A2284_00410 [Deltaproteobacteria bacterium RIFOXYA12_FULL_61_11]